MRLGLLPALDVIAVAIAETPGPALARLVDAFGHLLSPMVARLFLVQLEAADIIRITEGRVSLTPLGHRLRAHLGTCEDCEGVGVEVELATNLETAFDISGAVLGYLSARGGNA